MHLLVLEATEQNQTKIQFLVCFIRKGANGLFLKICMHHLGDGGRCEGLLRMENLGKYRTVWTFYHHLDWWLAKIHSFFFYKMCISNWCQCPKCGLGEASSLHRCHDSSFGTPLTSDVLTRTRGCWTKIRPKCQFLVCFIRKIANGLFLEICSLTRTKYKHERL